MGEYRNRTTGVVMTQGQIRAANPNMSLPRVWKQATLDALDLDPVLRSPAATVGAYQVSVRDGVVQDANGNWVENYVARDMFADDPELGTKAEQEAAYQAGLDAKVAETNRTQRNKLLDDTDYLALSDNTLSTEMSTYRQALRDISSHVNWPNLAEEDWPTKP